VVDQDDASYPRVGQVIPIRANHYNICKFSSEDEVGYQVVKAKLVELIKAMAMVQEKAVGISSQNVCYHLTSRYLVW
jgi:hypothetical protein